MHTHLFDKKLRSSLSTESFLIFLCSAYCISNVIRYCISIAVRWRVEYKFLIDEFLIHNVYIYYNKNTGTHYSLKSNGTVLLKTPSFIMEK